MNFFIRSTASAPWLLVAFFLSLLFFKFVKVSTTNLVRELEGLSVDVGIVRTSDLIPDCTLIRRYIRMNNLHDVFQCQWVVGPELLTRALDGWFQVR